MKAIIDRPGPYNSFRIKIAKPTADGLYLHAIYFKCEVKQIPMSGEEFPADCCTFINCFEAAEIAKALMEAAVEAGIIRDSSRSEGELTATKKHLEDMQKAFNKLLEMK